MQPEIGSEAWMRQQLARGRGLEEIDRPLATQIRDDLFLHGRAFILDGKRLDPERVSARIRP